MFTSARERRLWVWTVLVVVGIYATLGLASTLAAALRDRGLLDSAFVLAFLVMGAVIVALALKTRPGVTEVGIAIGVGVVYLMAFVRMGIPEERTHLFEYSLVAVLIHHALIERRSNGRPVRFPAALAVVVTALVGWLDEGIQGTLPDRVYDIVDVGFNALAGLMAVLATLALQWARRLRRSPSP